MQNSLNIPVSYDRADISPMTGISLNYPPFVPQYSGPNEIANQIPLIAAAAALEIQSNMQKNPLRMFTYNMMAQNGYNNPSFSMLVTTIADWAMVEVLAGTYTNLEDSMSECVVRMCEMVGSVMTNEFPDLRRVLPQEYEGPVTAQLRMFGDVMNRISQAKAGQVPPRSNSGGGVRITSNSAWGNSGASNNSSWIDRGNSTSSSSWGAPAQPKTIGLGGMSGVFGGGAPSHAHAATPVDVVRAPSRFSRSYAAKEEAVLVETKTQEVAVIPQAIIQSESALKWLPSALQYGIPAYNPRTHSMVLKQNDDGTVVAQLPEKDQAMNFDRHNIPSVFGQVPSHYKNEKAIKANESIKAGLEEIEAQKRKAAAEQKPEILSLVYPNFISAGSLGELWTEAMVHRYTQKNEQGQPTLYRIKGEVTETMVSTRDESAIMTKLGESFSYAELREKLLALRSSMTPQLWVWAERTMTAFINNRIANNMSIPGLSIDSFTDDFVALSDAVQKKYDSVILAAFLKDQAKYISRLFRQVVLADKERLTQFLFDDKEFPTEERPSLIFLSKRYSLTLLNTSSFNLELEFDPKIGGVLTSIYTPNMRAIAEQIFEELQEEEQISHVYLRTTDGRTLELTRGALSDDHYQLSLVN